tara:strand:- start:57 stop:512 length:456 start_codon:yes stop_codon:yes gene_type:complete
MKKKYAGYINLKPLNGVIYPSSIQNTIMKNFIENDLNGIFYLSPTEILQAKYSITLKTLLSSETKVKGIVMLSSFMLSKNYSERLQFYHQAIKAKKQIFFILDEINFKTKQDIEKIENFLIFNTSFFTETKKILNKYEDYFMKKYKKITFV